MAYMKSPKYPGTLTLQVGRGDISIQPGVKYNDVRLAKFVGQGFLIEVPDEMKAPTAAVSGQVLEKKPEPPKPVEKPAAAPEPEAKAAPAPAPEPQQSAKVEDKKTAEEPDESAASKGTTTKSPASKVKSAVSKVSSKKTTT